jgi:hypothetical protein
MKIRVYRFVLPATVAFIFVFAYASSGFAAPPPDPYADAVDPSTSGLILAPGNAVGAPDGNLATVVGLLGQNLVLDMGEDEEGTSDLIVYYGPLGLGVVASIQFLDANKQVIHTASLLLSANVGGAQVQVAYPNAPTPYRFVRFVSVLSAYTIDAVQAVTYRPDSDNDGLPDTWEIQHGLNPLDPTGSHGPDGDPDNDGLSNAQELVLGAHPNNPDTDGDGLPDGWEVQHGLNPLDATGSHGPDGDPDNDGLSNAQELVLGAHPNNPDTDGDGLPDGWEVQHGLNPLDPTGDNGPDGDPDNDGRTNLEEYLNGTNPVAFNGTIFLPLILVE